MESYVGRDYLVCEDEGRMKYWYLEKHPTTNDKRQRQQQQQQNAKIIFQTYMRYQCCLLPFDQF